ncbi:uncharacterized protein LOC134290951 [Aedes albopictus]|uniref:Uncharacterized protein n=1 Tax=Aedes albopictus TaxID=7160 RepID=A0ABM1ZXL4_AEDAL
MTLFSRGYKLCGAAQVIWDPPPTVSDHRLEHAVTDRHCETSTEVRGPYHRRYSDPGGVPPLLTTSSNFSTPASHYLRPAITVLNGTARHVRRLRTLAESQPPSPTTHRPPIGCPPVSPRPPVDHFPAAHRLPASISKAARGHPPAAHRLSAGISTAARRPPTGLPSAARRPPTGRPPATHRPPVGHPPAANRLPAGPSPAARRPTTGRPAIEPAATPPSPPARNPSPIFSGSANKQYIQLRPGTRDKRGLLCPPRKLP